MRRATLPSLAAAAIAAALVYGSRSPVPARPNAASLAETARPQPTPSAAAEPNASAPASTDAPATADAQSRSSPTDERAARGRGGPPRDEATMLADLRKRAIRDVRESYSLLLDDLDLTQQEREGLVAVLAELQVDGTWSGGRDGGWQKRGRTIGAQERHDRIAAVIGDEKLDEFLVLEVNAGEYYETQQIAALLRRKQTPLTERQRDGMFDILIEVRDRYQTELPPEIDPRSIERVVHTITQIDEHDRHVVELASSVLTPTQLVHLDEQYQRMAAERADSVERSKKLNAENPGKGFIFYTPGSWH